MIFSIVDRIKFLKNYNIFWVFNKINSKISRHFRFFLFFDKINFQKKKLQHIFFAHRTLAKRLQHHERNCIRRIQTHYRKRIAAEAAAAARREEEVKSEAVAEDEEREEEGGGGGGEEEQREKWVCVKEGHKS